MTEGYRTWPRELPGLGRLRILALMSCADCLEVGRAWPQPTMTWAVYGQRPLCRSHANARAAGKGPATVPPSVVELPW